MEEPDANRFNATHFCSNDNIILLYFPIFILYYVSNRQAHYVIPNFHFTCGVSLLLTFFVFVSILLVIMVSRIFDFTYFKPEEITFYYCSRPIFNLSER